MLVYKGQRQRWIPLCGGIEVATAADGHGNGRKAVGPKGWENILMATPGLCIHWLMLLLIGWRDIKQDGHAVFVLQLCAVRINKDGSIGVISACRHQGFLQ